MNQSIDAGPTGSAPGYTICPRCGTGGYGFGEHCWICCSREVASLKRDVKALIAQRDEARRRMYAPGVWLVEEWPGHRSEHLIGQLADLPDAVPLAAIARRKSEIAQAVVTIRERIGDGESWSAMDVAEAIVRELLAAERAER